MISVAYWFVYLPKFCACADNTFLVPTNSYDNRWRDSEKYCSEVLQKERSICILVSRFISLIFLQLLWTFWVFASYFLVFKILWPYLGTSNFGHPHIFPEVICPRYNPGIYKQNLWNAPVNDFFFLFTIFLIIFVVVLKAPSWKCLTPPSVNHLLATPCLFTWFVM